MAQNRTGGRAGRSSGKGSGSLNWLLVVVAVALAGTVALGVQHRRVTREKAATVVQAVNPAQVTPEPASAATMAAFENIPADVWAKVGTADALMPLFVGDSLAAHGKPVVFYVGAGYCPYCGATRWFVIASLSRFGKFTGLTLTASSPLDVYPSTPTFSFYGAEYESPYIELQSVELASSLIMSNGRYQPLEELTDKQEALMEKYDAPPYVDKAGEGGIPFLLVGGRYMWAGAPFSPTVLARHSQESIAMTLPKGAGSAAELILANANQLTATICAVDGHQPKDVCSQPVIVKAIAALPHKAP